MKIYRIFKWIQDYRWSPYSDDYMPIDDQETIKYVSSKEKVGIFLQKKADDRQACSKCLHCPLINLTKRQYKNGKHDLVINTYCDNKDIYFQGNNVFCKNEMEADMSDYDYEEIEVE